MSSLANVRPGNAGRVLAIAVMLLFLGLGTNAEGPVTAPVQPPARPQVVLATTVALKDSGLLAVLLPYFEQETGYTVEPLGLDSAKAMPAGEAGKADALLIDAPRAEEKFVSDGYGTGRRLVLQADYVIVGSPADRAHVRGKPALAALKAIASTGSTFISRRDGSDANLKELDLWQSAMGRDVQHEGWYVSTHNDMTVTLAEANRRSAYAFTDRTTYLKDGNLPNLQILVENDPLLVAPYHIIEVNPQKLPQVNAAGAKALSDFLVSPQAQAIIGSYGTARYGRALFVPDAGEDTAH